MIRRVLARGMALALLLGFAPNPLVYAAGPAPAKCRMACAKTDACCCKRRASDARPVHGDGPWIEAGKSTPSCPSECASGVGTSQSTSHAAAGIVLTPVPPPDPGAWRVSLPQRAGRRECSFRSPRAPPVPDRTIEG